MTASASSSLYTAYKRFGVSRIQHWKPKIYANLLQMIRNATDEPTIERAIKKLDENMLKPSGIAVTLQKIYVDAGRVWGAKIYQMITQEAKKLISRSEKELAFAIEGRMPRKSPVEISRMSKIHSLAQQEKRLMPIGYNEELVADVIAYLRLHNLQMVSEISDTMKAWLFDKFSEAQQEGRSIQQVADELIKHDFPKNRSMVIARTESLKAANVGAMQGAKKTGFVMEKEWIAARDIRTRRTPRDEFSHVAMNGKTVPMDEPFLVPNRNGSHDSLMQPLDPKGDAGDVIQCRCTVGFNVVRDARGLPMRV